MNETEQDEGLKGFVIKQFRKLLEWLKPLPGDPKALRLLKTFLKSIVVLLLIAISPVVIVVLILVFFITL